ncbi:MAG: D-alanine--D-alanine ligase [Phycisphaerae bacterium]|jgi:D-alanine-D-alanine ligase
MEGKVVATEGDAVKVTRPKLTLDITVLMGGPSSERDVSLVSGAAIAEALEGLGHRVQQADISPRDTSALDREGIDVVFIALHGAFGESGEVQQLCEQRGLRYTGSPQRASEIAMDKTAAKAVFARAGLAVPEGKVITAKDDPAQVRAWMATLGLPIVLKPADGGSSVDVTIAKTADLAERALADLLAKYGCGLVERFVRGREFTVGVLGDRALPVLQVIPPGEFYDYTAKYADNSGTRYVFDHGLPAKMAEAMQSAALVAHRALGCRDMSRVDFILPGDGLPVVLEVNTIPGFTGHSLLPMAAARVGISFPLLVERIVAMAMQR